MFKNTASQKLRVFAYDSTTNLPKSGDSANITAYVSKDYGAVTALTDTSATEEDATNAKGFYLFDLTQAETNADVLGFSAKSATANIVVVAVPAVVYTRPPNFSALAITAGGVASADAVAISGDATAADNAELFFDGTGYNAANSTVGTVTTYTGNTPQTGDCYARIGAPAGASVSADIAAVKSDSAAILVDTGTTLDGYITAIKTKTDSLTFTVPGQVDANAQYVNDIEVTGTGAVGDEWGP